MRARAGAVQAEALQRPGRRHPGGLRALLKFNLKIYVYPTLDTNTGEVQTAANLKVGRGDPSRWTAHTPHKLSQYIFLGQT